MPRKEFIETAALVVGLIASAFAAFFFFDARYAKTKDVDERLGGYEFSDDTRLWIGNADNLKNKEGKQLRISLPPDPSESLGQDFPVKADGRRIIGAWYVPSDEIANLSSFHGIRVTPTADNEVHVTASLQPNSVRPNQIVEIRLCVLFAKKKS